MTDTPDITEVTHQRDSDGRLQPVSETVEIYGDQFRVGIKPPTTGERNEWLRRLDGAEDQLSDEVVAELLDTFAEHSPEDFGTDNWQAVRPAVTDAYAEAVLAKIAGAEDTEEFRAALDEAVGEQGNQSATQ